MSSTSAKPAETALTSDDWRPFPFRRVLPVAQLFVCALILWPYRAWIGYELFGLTPHHIFSSPSENTPPVDIRVDTEGKLELPAPVSNIVRAHENAFDTVAALSFPGGMVQLPYAIYSKDHREWIPGHIDFKTWRALTWPLVALPFWWMAGRGAEALTAARRKVIAPRMRWLEVVIGFLLMSGGLAIAIGYVFFSTTADRADPSFRLLSTASGMWGLLGSLTVVAKLAQWRIKKKIPAPSIPAL